MCVNLMSLQGGGNNRNLYNALLMERLRLSKTYKPCLMRLIHSQESSNCTVNMQGKYTQVAFL